MTNRFALFALFGVCLLAASCRTGPPEGVYPCTEATVATDCPTGWYCHSDDRCWSRIETFDGGTDGGVPADAPMTDAPGHDAAPTRDSGPTCGTETCNGSDDDCDGLVDEGVMTVGPAVPLSATNAQGGTLLATASGFGALASAFSADETYVSTTWFPMDTTGTPGTELPLGTDLPQAYPGVDATVLGGNVVFSLIDGAADHRVLIGFDPSSGARTTGTAPFTLPLPSGRTPTTHSAFAAASSRRVTAYVGHVGSTTYEQRISRMHVDVGGTTPMALNSYEIVADGETGGFAALSTPAVDYVLYRRMDGRVVLLAGPSGEATGAFHTVGLVGGTTPPFFDYASMAIRDPASPVSPTNPLGIAWAGRAGVGSRVTTLSFLEVTNTTVFASTTLVSFPDAIGSWGGFFTARTVHLLALPDAPEHWILVNQDASATPLMGGLVQVRELIGPGSTVRRIPVPGEMVGPRTDIGLAVSGGTIRLLEGANTAGLVTRSIGCE